MSDDKFDDKVRLIPVTYKKPVDESQYLKPVEYPPPCRHGPYLVNESLNTVTCEKCGEKLNPVWVLHRMATEETHWHHLRERYMDEMKRLHERSRTQCDYCGRMTRISRR